MTGIGTAFKKIYGDALAPIGFVKIKGRQPYFVRLIGDEILHIITYINDFTIKDRHKAFNILGGVVTVYSTDLDLENSPKINAHLLHDNRNMYDYRHRYDIDWEYRNKIGYFEYEVGNEESLFCAVKRSLDVTKEIMLPEFDQVVDLKSCLDYYRIFATQKFAIFSKDNRISGNEGLFGFKVYSIEEYRNVKIELHEENIRYLRYLMENNRWKITEEEYEKERIRGRKSTLEQIALFEKVMNDPELYAGVIRELERRKLENMEKLKKYGLIV